MHSNRLLVTKESLSTIEVVDYSLFGERRAGSCTTTTTAAR